MIFETVVYKNEVCLVTNNYLHGGKKVEISPVGNGLNKAIYFKVWIDEIKKLPPTQGAVCRKHNK